MRMHGRSADSPLRRADRDAPAAALPGRVIVVGSGAMAPGIAAAHALLPDARIAIAGRSLERAAAAAATATALAGREVVAAPLDERALHDAELVIETVVEDLAVKQELFGRIERWVARADALLTTNTSSCSIPAIAGALERPERLAGMHFLKPAHATELVEVIVPGTAEDVVERLVAVVRAIDKQPLVVRTELAGFVWNRLQFALLRECLHMLDAGVADAATIDAAVSDGLAPRWLAGGPLATADLGGLETFRLVSQQLFPQLADTHEVSDALVRRAATGAGFHDWTPERLEAIERLRDRVLREGRAVAAERRRAMGAGGGA